MGKRSAVVLGAGVNATLFSSHVHYKNPNFTLIINNSDTTRYRAVRSHDLGQFTSAYFAMDFQVLYSLRFNAGKSWGIVPYAGVKFRNVVYIKDEQRNLETGPSILEKDGNDTVFYININTDYRMRDSRIVIMPTLGITVEKPLVNGGKLGLFVDYSYAIANRLQITYQNFDNVEQFEVTQSNSQGSSTFLMTNSVDYERDGLLVLALDMSHVRLGVSYTLPQRKR